MSCTFSKLNNKSINISADSKRGLSLYGLLDNLPPMRLRYLDTCANAVKDIIEHDYSFQDDISRFGGYFGAFVITNIKATQYLQPYPLHLKKQMQK